MTFNPNQLAAADAIDELGIGEGIEFVNGVYVERESPTRFKVNDEVMCFIQACDIAMRGL
jgi:hypothetical protein